jgi:hypothetical protein
VKQLDCQSLQDVSLGTGLRVFTARLTPAAIQLVILNNTEQLAFNVTLHAILASGQATLNAGHAL